MRRTIPSLNWLRVFEAAARVESFSRAAEMLNMSTSAVSQQIKALESHLGSILATMGDFELDTTDLEDSWKRLNEQIQELVDNNTEIQNIISELRKSKVRGTAADMRGALKDEKIINIEDFLDPK